MEYIVVDGHCDSVLDVANGIRKLSEHSSRGHLDFPRLQGNVNLQFMALFVESLYKPNNCLLRSLDLLDILVNEINNVNYVDTVFKKGDLNHFQTGKVKVLISIEGGEALAGSLSVLRCFFQLGVRSITLTWNHRNEIADGCNEDPLGYGVSRFGKQVIKEMNNLGMLIDISHIAEKGFWDVLESTQKPIIASHSCCQELCNHPRNLSDKQLKAIAENDGVVGINFYPSFLNENGKSATINDVVKHIVHAAEIMGTEHVGLGSDFDGINCTPKGLEDTTKTSLLIPELKKVGFSSGDIANIMGNSFLRVLKKVLPDD